MTMRKLLYSVAVSLLLILLLPVFAHALEDKVQSDIHKYSEPITWTHEECTGGT